MAEMVPIAAGFDQESRGGADDRALRSSSHSPERWEYQVLRLVAEQGAIPFDQLARFIDCQVEQAARVAKHLTRAGYADYGRILAYEPHWLWLTWRGMRFSGLTFAAGRPGVGGLARIRAVNEVRLYIAGRAPEARWRCRRSLLRDGGMRGGPNAVVEAAGERHAIVVRYGKPQEPSREIRFIDSHIRRYDAMVCFANPAPMAQLKRLQATRHWPKLLINPIPTPA